MNEMLIFELDGGTWTVMQPLLEKGLLPNIARLVRLGASGVLHSITPLLSPALWTTIYTGQPRKLHGAQTFDATSQDIRYKRLWDIAHTHGMTCGICGSLVTWPPYDVGGFMIPDIMARDTSTIPPQFSILQELVLNYPGRRNDKKDYGATQYVRHAFKLRHTGIKVKTITALAKEVLASVLLRRPYRESYWRRALLLQDLYADAFLRLYRTHRPNLSSYHYHSVDTLSHWYWHLENNGARLDKDIVSQAYQAADYILGRFLQVLSPDATVMVLSDHGFQSNPKDRPRYKARLTRWIQALGLEKTVTPTRLAHQHFLYFRNTARLQETHDTLRRAYFKETGDRVLPRVVMRDESIFFPPPLTHAEGLTVVIPGHVELPFEELFEVTGLTEHGIHAPEGIAILAGPTIRPRTKLQEASILDVAPTALAILGLPIARDMQGRVWAEAFHPEYLQQSPPTFVDTYQKDKPDSPATELDEEESQILYQRLSDLGYL